MPGPNLEYVMLYFHNDFARKIQRAYKRHAEDKYLTMVGTLPCVIIQKILFYVLLNYTARRQQLVRAYVLPLRARIVVKKSLFILCRFFSLPITF